MLGKIWQWLKRFFQQLFGGGTRQSGNSPREIGVNSGTKPTSVPLTDTDYEFLFTQLLEGVIHGWQKSRIEKFFDGLGDRGQPELWIAWLRRFGERVLASPAPNNELAARMVKLGEVADNEIGSVAYEIGMQLLTRDEGEPIWEYDGADAYLTDPNNQGEIQTPPPPGASETITLDELLDRLEKDAGLLEQIAQQLGIDTTEPQVIIDTLANQFNQTTQLNQDNSLPTDDAGILIQEAVRQFQSNDYNGSVSTLNHAVQIYPNNPLVWYAQGEIMQVLQRNEEAIASYDKALQLNPELHDAWNNRGLILLNLEQFDRAISCFSQAVKIKPDLYQSWYNWGEALLNLESFESAVDKYEKSTQINPDYYEGWLQQGYALVNLERFEEAIACYKKATEINPNIYEGWYNWGVALQKSSRFDEALVCFEKAKELHPSSVSSV